MVWLKIIAIRKCDRMKGIERIDKWVNTIHGKQPICKCGAFLYIVQHEGEEPEWACLKCNRERFEVKE